MQQQQQQQRQQNDEPELWCSTAFQEKKKESEIEMNECWSVHLHEAADDDGNGADDGCKKQNKSLRYVGGAGNQRWLHHHRHQHWPTQAPPNEVNATCFGAKETQIEEPGKHQSIYISETKGAHKKIPH